MKLCFFFVTIVVVMGCNKPAVVVEEVRGIWVPDPSHTSVLHSYNNVVEFVDMVDDLNLNAIFLASYARSKTIFKSPHLLKNTNYTHLDSTSLMAPYFESYDFSLQSPTGDPVQDLLDEAHRRNIKVFFWFEFGFMGDIKPIGEGNPILAKNPTWLGIGNDGSPAHYNNDYYFNAYDTAVQSYLKDLILESIELYPSVDGIQGDDRMPAMPRNSGYDPYTVAKYQLEHDGSNPPFDENEEAWVRWRLDILNGFGKMVFDEVTAKNPNVMISFAPNPYPWCLEKLMQEWPNWVENGICDLLAVQCYRSTAESYRNTVVEAMSHLPANGERTLFVPGIILRADGEMKISPEVLKEQLLINRELKTHGEIFFYNEGLKDSAIRTVLQEIYLEKATFPTLLRSKD